MTMVTNASPRAGAKPNRQQRRQAARLAKKGRRGNGAAAPTDATLQEAVKLHKAGHPHEALQLYRKVLAVRPDQFDALNLGGVANCELGHIGEAVKLLQAAVRLEPSYAEAHNNLGNALKAADRLDEAAAAYRRAIGVKPGYAEPHYNLGILLQKSSDTAGAMAAYRRATEINPNFAEAHNSLGAMLQEFGELDDAIAACRRAIEIRPDYTTAHSNLGAALLRGGHSDEALAHCHHALRLDPNDVSAHNNLGMVLKDMGRLDEAIEAYRNALTLKPSFSEAHSNLIFTMNFHSRFTAESILAESRHWDEIHALPHAIRARPHANTPDPERRLRIGYVSPDFRCHSVSYFIESLLAAHDRNAVEVFCYAEVARPDEVTTRLRALADGWRWTFGTSDEALAEHIREDGIDILIDLAGHTSSNRLLTFAQRPAPVQATWLGYPNTTGLTAMDYRLTDAIVDPEGTADAVHSEKLVRLPKSFLCYVPPADAPEIADLPAAANGYITFGSFNNLAKVTPDVVEVWATILHHTPGSRILLKSRLFAQHELRKRYKEMFVAHGVDIECIELVPDIPSVSGHLAAYAGVDIGLDPFPYNGTTTTCEALWMGVPMITLSGDRHAARVGLGLLTSMGMPELAAATQEAYIRTAVDLAGDLDRLLALRESLRTRMRNSPLCDAKAFAHDIEAAYRDMWRPWCARSLELRPGDNEGRIQLSDFLQKIENRPAPSPEKTSLSLGPGIEIQNLKFHSGGKVLIGVCQQGKYFAKIELIHNPNKSNSIEQEANIMARLNERGCVSAPKVHLYGTIGAEDLLPCLGEEQRAFLRSVPNDTFPFIVEEYLPLGTSLNPADMILSLIEQKNLGVYHGDLKPDNLRVDEKAGICYFIDYDQAEFLDDDVINMDNISFLKWCDERAKEKYDFSSFLQYFPSLSVNNNFMKYFRNRSFNIGATTIYSRQQTTLAACGIYHTLQKESIHSDGERDIGDRRSLLDTVAFAPGERILDVGCNAGLVSMYLHDRNCRVTGIDLDQSIIYGARFVANILGKDIRYQCVDLDKGEIPGEFDTVILFSVLHHTRNVARNAERIAGICQRILIECRLRENGAKPEDGIWKVTSAWQYDHVDDLIAMLEDLFPGFKLVKNHGKADRERYLLEFAKQ